MPAPARTSRDSIVAAARSLLTSGGADAVTMRSVAAATGVQAPSLYKHVANRAELIVLVIAAVADEVRVLLASAASTGDPAEDLRAMARALRDLAATDSHAFALLFSPPAEAGLLDPAVYAAAATPILEAAARLAGPDHALDAARTVTAWAAGFLGMELAGAFRLGGSVDHAFDYGIDVLVAALDARG